MFFQQTNTISREYRMIKSYEPDKVAKIARSSFPQSTARNVTESKFARNAYPLRTSPKNIAQIHQKHFGEKKIEEKKKKSK